MLLDNMIKAMGFTTEEVYVCNVIKCRPPNNRKPEIEEVGACKSYWVRQLEILSPKVIVTLGGTAMDGLLGPGLGISKRRGTWGQYNDIPVMPTYHPSYCLRNPSSKREVWQDLQAVMKLLPQKR